MRRYIPRESFVVALKGGVEFQVIEDARGPDGLPGLPSLPAEVLKRDDLMVKFDIVTVENVEAATAAPGQKRAAKRPRKTP